MLVAVLFPDVVGIVPGVAAVSGLFVDIFWVIVVLVPIVLFHSAAVLSLSTFFCLSPARSLRISLVCCYCSVIFALLALSLPPACVISSFPKLARAYVVLECAPALSFLSVLLLYTVRVCQSCVVFV